MHVKDLRWIINTTGCAVLLVFAAALLLTIVLDTDMFARLKKHDTLLPFQVSSVMAGFGLIAAWCYQTGSARLGIVDLFACEITTLCRICTINGLADTCIAAFEVDTKEHPPFGNDDIIKKRERFSHFDSSEDYTPVFSANAKELRSLSVKVVTNITAFYTYWKAMRDALRRLANTPATTAVVPSNTESDAWHKAMREVIYMQFLALESARNTVRDLIEFEPNNAENTITILLSELPAYQFLLTSFPEDDVRHTRLELRRGRYQTIVPQIYYHTEDQYTKYNDTDTLNKQSRHRARTDLDELRRDWDKAHRMLKELKTRYEATIGELPRRDAIVLSNKMPEAELPPRVELSMVRS
jgi:hypothetical protein